MRYLEKHQTMDFMYEIIQDKKHLAEKEERERKRKKHRENKIELS